MCTRTDNAVREILDNPASYSQEDGRIVRPQSFYSVDLNKRYKVFVTNPWRWINPSPGFIFLYSKYKSGHDAEVFEGKSLRDLCNFLSENTEEVSYFNFYEVASEPEPSTGIVNEAVRMADTMYIRGGLSTGTHTALASGAYVIVERYGTERTPNKFTIVKVMVKDGLIGTGVAAVHPRDKYNPEAGKRLAMNRAILDLDRKFNG